MDNMILFGFITACLAIYFGATDVQNDLLSYLDINSFVLVLFGTLGSTMISTSRKEFGRILKGFKDLILRKKKLEPTDAVKIMVRISALAQQNSKQALIQEIRGSGNAFLENGLRMVGAGLDKEFIRRTLETDIDEIKRRDLALVSLVKTMGSYAPMFGMAGTVLGVTQVLIGLKDASDIDNIISGMSLALLTTLYGLLMSSVIFIPMANKIKNTAERDLLTKEIMLEGIMFIMDKDIPLKVEKYLSAYIEAPQKTNREK